MRKFFLTLAVLVMAICANAQKNQYFWYQGNLMLGNPIAQIDSVTFGEDESTDTLHILLPRTTTQTIVVHDTVYITVKDTNNSADIGDKTYLGHEFVDLGLPSGLLWATCNVGAESPEQVGEYYAWGELETKSSYTNATYQYQDWYGTGEYIYIGDEISNTQYDVAKNKLGGEWRMPTSLDAQELLDNCDRIDLDNGCKYVGSNGNTIFIPKSGYRQWESILSDFACLFWTSTYYPNSDPNYPDANSWAFYGDQVNIMCRRFGLPVRPVLNKDVVANSGAGTQPATIVHDTIYITIHDTVCPNENIDTTHNGFRYVDLGLSVMWADANVGAENPEDYGNYYSWGETEPKDTYHWYNYKYGEYKTMNKYCLNSENGTIDGLSTLLPEDDAASVNMGGTWRTPTKAEWQELIDNCVLSFDTINSHPGLRYTASNGKSIFIPLAVSYWYDTIDDYWNYGNFGSIYHGAAYWSADVNPNESCTAFFFSNRDHHDTFNVDGAWTRQIGGTVRGVFSK